MTLTEISIRLIVATILGACIGLERQMKHHPAGLRTNTLVCIGSASIMILSELINARQFEIYGTAGDPGRMAAQVKIGRAHV